MLMLVILELLLLTKSVHLHLSFPLVKSFHSLPTFLLLGLLQLLISFLSLALSEDLVLSLLLLVPLITLLSSLPYPFHPNPLLYAVISPTERSGSITKLTLMPLMTLSAPLTGPLFSLKTSTLHAPSLPPFFFRLLMIISHPKLFLTILFLPGSPDLFFTRSNLVGRFFIGLFSPSLHIFYLIIGHCVMLFLLKSKSLSPNFSNPSPTHLRNFGHMFDPSDRTRILFLLSHPPLVLLSQIQLVKLTSSIRLSLVFSSNSPCYCTIGPL